MSVVDDILSALAEAMIDENWCLDEIKSTCNAFINGKYLPNIIDDLGGKYLHVH